MQQLGIIRGYTLNYKTLRTVAFEVDYAHEWEMDTAAGKLKEFLLKTGVGEADADAALRRIQEFSRGRRRRGGDVFEGGNVTIKDEAGNHVNTNIPAGTTLNISYFATGYSELGDCRLVIEGIPE